MSQIEDKNEAARTLLARGRLREALDALNQAVRIDPRYPVSYANRAEVFERLGMLPQAAADRQRAWELEAAAGSSTAAPPAPPPGAGGPQPASPAQPAGPPQRPPAPGRSAPGIGVWASVADAVQRVPWGLMAMVGGAIVMIVAVVLAGSALIGGGGDGNGAADTTTGTPTGQASGTATPTPTEAPSPAGLEGRPFSFKELQKAWQAKSLVATAGAASAGFTGFSRNPVAVTLKRGADTAKLSIFAYPSPQSVSDDWELTPGKAPVAKGARSLPAHRTIWWNQNIIVVMLTDSDEIGRDALDAFLALSP